MRSSSIPVAFRLFGISDHLFIKLEACIEFGNRKVSLVCGMLEWPVAICYFVLA